MRAREFLIEYSKAKTAEMVGDKLIKALVQDRQPPANLKEIQGKAAMGPSWYEHYPESMKSWTEAILSAIEDKDPTPNKAYTPWLARMYAKGGLKLEDIDRNGLLELHNIAKGLGERRGGLIQDHKDINKFKTYRDFEEVMRTYDRDAIEAPAQKIDKGIYSEIPFTNVTMYIPENEAASVFLGNYLGGPSHWCTAGRKNNLFDQYNRQGKLYILIPKHPNHDGEKYQLHFPSGQYMNEDDDEVSLTHLFSLFPELKEFFIENEPEMLNFIEFAPDDVLQSVIDRIAELAQDQVWEIINEWEHDDNYYYQQMQEKHADENRDIDWDSVYEAGDDYLKWNDEARRFQIDMSDALRMKASDLKKWISEIVIDTSDVDQNYKIDALPELMADKIREEFPARRGENGSHGIDRFLDHNVFVQKTANGWDVKLARSTAWGPRPIG
jgi:hypothetical protein